MPELDLKVAVLEEQFKRVTDDISDIKIVMDKMNDKLDELNEHWLKFGGLYTQLEGQNKRINDQQQEIKDLQTFKNNMRLWQIKLITGISVIGTVVLIAWNVFGDFIKSKFGL